MDSRAARKSSGELSDDGSEGMMQSVNRLVARGASRRQMSTVAAATLTSDVPDYVLKAAEPTVTKLGNGVTVASLYGG